jgi:hypothetical protein
MALTMVFEPAVSATTRRLFIVGGFALAGCAPASAAGVAFSVRMKHTFVIDERPVVASSVMSVTISERPKGMGDQFSFGLKAEAAVGDFGPLGLVIVPLRSASGRSRFPVSVLLEGLIGFRRLGYAERSAAIKQLPSLKTEVVLKPEEWPLLVRFKDVGSPASVVELNPANMFPESGTRTVLKSSSLQVVDERPTSLIVSVLPWVPTLPGALSGSRGVKPDGPAAEILSQTDFKIG